jgi:hypothetical protein
MKEQEDTLRRTFMSGLILNKFPVLLLYFGILLTGACHLMVMEELSIVEHSPSTKVVQEISECSVSVTFSQDIDKIKTAKAFLLLNNQDSMDGEVSWENDRTIRFTPFESLKENNKYTVSISTSATDIYGNSLSLPFSYSFSNKEDELRPVLLSHNPEDRDILDQNDQSVTLTFSESMDISSVLDAFTIIPSIAGSYSWNADTTIFTFTPFQPFTWQTEYRIKLNVNASDLMGNTLSTQKNFTFFTGLDSFPPILQQISNGSRFILTNEDEIIPGITINSLWEADWGMEFTFNPEDQISINSFRIKLNFKPAVTFEINNSEDLYQNPISITFPNRLTWNTSYQIKLESGYEDEYQNSGQAATYYVKVDGPLTSPPVVNDIALLVNPGDPQGTIIHTFDSFSFNTYNPGAQGFIDIYVSLPRQEDVSAETILFSFMDNFDFVAPSTALIAAIQELRLIGAGDSFLARAAAADELVFRVYLIFQDQDSGGNGSIFLNNGFSDGLGNKLSENYEMRIQIM